MTNCTVCSKEKHESAELVTICVARKMGAEITDRYFPHDKKRWLGVTMTRPHIGKDKSFGSTPFKDLMPANKNRFEYMWHGYG